MTVQEERRYLWSAIDQYGDTIDILVQEWKDKYAAIFQEALQNEGSAPNRMITDKLKSYAAAKREVMPDVVRCVDRHADSRCEA